MCSTLLVIRPIKLAILLGLVVVTSCHPPAPDAEGQRKTLSLQFIDSAAIPGNDFARYANGKWLDTATIPPTEYGAGARWEMDDSVEAHVHLILESAAGAHAATGTITRQIGDLYLAGMDTLSIDHRGAEPVEPFLKAIDSIRDAKDILLFAASQIRIGFPLLISQGIAPDKKNSSRNIANYYQFGLGLPDRDYYVKKDSATLALIAAYKLYLTTLFTLSGDKPAAAAQKADQVFALESQIAVIHKTNVELMDPRKNYHKMAVSDAQKAMPLVGWETLLKALGVSSDSINIEQPEYYQGLNALLRSTPLDIWKSYLRVHTLDNAANYLSHDFETASFAYYDQALNGQRQIKPRWQRLYYIIDANMGEALGQLYVQHYFSAAAKQRITELVGNLQKAFAARIDHLDWMGDSTRKTAKEKLLSMTVKVGYPDKWKDYTQVVIQKDRYFESLVSAARNNYRHNLAKVDQPVDHSEWGMTPPTDNAYYNAAANEIVFPAGILTFPMFDVASDDALNYGGIGMVIGHEMTHGFDDQGAQFDKDGNLKNWWQKDDLIRFKAKCEQIIRLYNTFTVLDSLHVNGRYTQGENTADVGGLAIAYDAFKLTPEGRDTARIDGLTSDQRFFLSFAQTWRKKVTDASLRTQVNTDEHSPGKYRIWGPLMNNPSFYQAFNVRPENAMYLADTARVHIW